MATQPYLYWGVPLPAPPPASVFETLVDPTTTLPRACIVTYDQNRKSHGKKKPPGHIKRPRNAWILFRCNFVNVIKALGCTERDQTVLTRYASDVWAQVTDAQKQPWAELFKIENARHHALYPEYSYVPVRAKREESATEVASKGTDAKAKVTAVRRKNAEHDEEYEPRRGSRKSRMSPYGHPSPSDSTHARRIAAAAHASATSTPVETPGTPSIPLPTLATLPTVLTPQTWQPASEWTDLMGTWFQADPSWYTPNTLSAASADASDHWPALWSEGPLNSAIGASPISPFGAYTPSEIPEPTPSPYIASTRVPPAGEPSAIPHRRSSSCPPISHLSYGTVAPTLVTTPTPSSLANALGVLLPPPQAPAPAVMVVPTATIPRRAADDEQLERRPSIAHAVLNDCWMGAAAWPASSPPSMYEPWCTASPAFTNPFGRMVDAATTPLVQGVAAHAQWSAPPISDSSRVFGSLSSCFPELHGGAFEGW